MRAMDLIAPIGRGQRGLIVAPPRTGKTMLLQRIAKAVLANHPEVVVIVLLVDERPEEVTDFRMTIGKSAEIVASSNDNPYRRHIEVTEQVLDKAKRLVLEKRDVLVLFDSLTRMTRAYNNELARAGAPCRAASTAAPSRCRAPSSAPRASSRRAGRSRSSARCWSTPARGWTTSSSRSSRAPGTWSSTSRASWPTAASSRPSTLQSGTRREELLFTEDELKRIHLLRRALSGTKPVQAMEAMLERLRLTADQRGVPEVPRRLAAASRSHPGGRRTPLMSAPPGGFAGHARVTADLHFSPVSWPARRVTLPPGTGCRAV